MIIIFLFFDDKLQNLKTNVLKYKNEKSRCQYRQTDSDLLKKYGCLRELSVEVMDLKYDTSIVLNLNTSGHERKKNHTCYICMSKFSTLEDLEVHKYVHSESDESQSNDYFSEENYVALVNECEFLYSIKKKVQKRTINTQDNIAEGSSEQVHDSTLSKTDCTNQQSIDNNTKENEAVENVQEEINNTTPIQTNTDTANETDIAKQVTSSTDLSEMSFKCVSCNIHFNNPSVINSHEGTSDKCTFLCLKCNRTFKTKYGMVVHIMEHINNCYDKEHFYTCTVCNRKFKNSLQHKRHIWTHSKSVGKKLGNRKECNKLKGIKESIDVTLTPKKRTYKKSVKNTSKDANSSTKKASKKDICNQPRQNTEQKDFTCEICYDIFKNKKELDHHTEFHKDIVKELKNVNVKGTTLKKTNTGTSIHERFCLEPIPAESANQYLQKPVERTKTPVCRTIYKRILLPKGKEKIEPLHWPLKAETNTLKPEKLVPENVSLKVQRTGPMSYAVTYHDALQQKRVVPLSLNPVPPAKNWQVDGTPKKETISKSNPVPPTKNWQPNSTPKDETTNKSPNFFTNKIETSSVASKSINAPSTSVSSLNISTQRRMSGGNADYNCRPPDPSNTPMPVFNNNFLKSPSNFGTETCTNFNLNYVHGTHTSVPNAYNANNKITNFNDGGYYNLDSAQLGSFAPNSNSNNNVVNNNYNINQNYPTQASPYPLNVSMDPTYMNYHRGVNFPQQRRRYSLNINDNRASVIQRPDSVKPITQKNEPSSSPTAYTQSQLKQYSEHMRLSQTQTDISLNQCSQTTTNNEYGNLTQTQVKQYSREKESATENTGRNFSMKKVGLNQSVQLCPNNEPVNYLSPPTPSQISNYTQGVTVDTKNTLGISETQTAANLNRQHDQLIRTDNEAITPSTQFSVIKHFSEERVETENSSKMFEDQDFISLNQFEQLCKSKEEAIKKVAESNKSSCVPTKLTQNSTSLEKLFTCIDDLEGPIEISTYSHLGKANEKLVKCNSPGDNNRETVAIKNRFLNEMLSTYKVSGQNAEIEQSLFKGGVTIEPIKNKIKLQTNTNENSGRESGQRCKLYGEDATVSDAGTLSKTDISIISILSEKCKVEHEEVSEKDTNKTDAYKYPKPCAICTKVITDHDSFLCHNPNKTSCKYCADSFCKILDLENHYLSKHKSFFCCLCKFLTNSRDEYLIHEKGGKCSAQDDFLSIIIKKQLDK